MKLFWIGCLLMVGLMGVVGSCGPKHAYCPDEPDMECRPPPEEGGQGGTGGSFNPCPDGGSQIFVDGQFICK